MVASLSKEARPPQQSKARTHTTLRTYSAVARARPPNPSLVPDLAQHGNTEDNRPRPEVICGFLNRKADEGRAIRGSRANAKAWGNFVLWEVQLSTPQTLNVTTPYTGRVISKGSSYPMTPPCKPGPMSNGPSSSSMVYPQACPRIGSLHARGVPQSALSFQPLILLTHGYAETQPDGSKLRPLLADRYPCAFGNVAKVKKWKQRTTNPKNKCLDNAAEAEHNNDGGTNDEEDVYIILNEPHCRGATPTTSTRGYPTQGSSHLTR